MSDPTRKIKIGDKVMLKRGPDGGRVDIYRIVPPAEADPDLGRISADSPLGSAVLGRSAGEAVNFEAAGFPKTVLILRLLPESGE